MEFWKDRNVLVTGVTGFLGSWLVAELHKLGANVVGLVRDHVPQCNLYLSGMDKKIKIVHGSITNLPLIERIIHEYNIDTVFHLAAQAIVNVANSSPLSKNLILLIFLKSHIFIYPILIIFNYIIELFKNIFIKIIDHHFLQLSLKMIIIVFFSQQPY